MKTAIVTGITGQDGRFMAQLLLSKGYKVHGIKRRTSVSNLDRLQPIADKIGKDLFIHDGDVTDAHSINHLVQDIQPDEFYNLAAQSFVPASFTSPQATAMATGVGVLNCLEAVRLHSPDTKFYQASSSEMFGRVTEEPQTELTPFRPRSPYACAKAYAHYLTINYRESYNLFACCGICFNHESEVRGLQFVTRKISHTVARIKHKLQDDLVLGNLDAERDWGHAEDFVRAMWLMLQHHEPDDYVIATGQKHTVREFAHTAFEHVDLHYMSHVSTDPKFMRPAEVTTLCGNANKALKKLGWRPSISFEDLVKRMVDSDMALVAGPESH
jgi:GDPmannose 4,6-dehydratase